MSKTLTVYMSTVANVVDDGFAPKGLTIIEHDEGGALVEYTRPRTQKRDRRFIPSQQILMLTEGNGDADSGFVAVQELATPYTSIEIEEFEVQGEFIVATDVDGAVHHVPAALAQITELDVEEEAAPKKKAAAKKDKKADKKPAKEKKGGKKGGKKDEWDD
ncbi:hypothetical protein GR7B_00111 [Vibrio phage vB_VcorM_GR7B]|nr:hypothetical protein GR7B_00111 [Vibrio phage vB_VcorM_GR7B]